MSCIHHLSFIIYQFIRNHLMNLRHTPSAARRVASRDPSICSRVARNDSLSPANRPVRMPSFLAGARSSAIREPMCRMFSAAMPGAAACSTERNSFSAGLRTCRAHESAQNSGANRLIQGHAAMLPFQTPLQLQQREALAVRDQSLPDAAQTAGAPAPPPRRDSRPSPASWREKSRRSCGHSRSWSRKTRRRTCIPSLEAFRRSLPRCDRPGSPDTSPATAPAAGRRAGACTSGPYTRSAAPAFATSTPTS